MRNFAALWALMLAACTSGEPQPPLAGAPIGGPFTLTSHEGQKVSNADFDGRYRLIYFGYSFCPDVCPVDMQHLGAGLKRFERHAPERADKVQPIFITIDPERDDPEALAEFVANFHPRLVGLTGTVEQIEAVADDYKIYYRKAGDPGAENYLMDHSRMAMLFGPEGEPITMVPAGRGQGPEAVAETLDTWVG
ncbi:MAG: SCO family protein [Sphingomonadaceae bacterium]